MLKDRVSLAILAVAFAMLAMRPASQRVQAQAADYSRFYIEPGTTVIRTPDGRGQVQGKIMIDRSNGEVWGFPTASTAPYPVVLAASEPPTSKPVYLGKFDLTATATAPRTSR